MRFRNQPDVLNSVVLSKESYAYITLLNMNHKLKFKRCSLKKEEELTLTGYVTRTGDDLFFVCDKVHKDGFWLCVSDLTPTYCSPTTPEA